jgi:hypothetical protein
MPGVRPGGSACEDYERIAKESELTVAYAGHLPAPLNWHDGPHSSPMTVEDVRSSSRGAGT